MYSLHTCQHPAVLAPSSTDVCVTKMLTGCARRGVVQSTCDLLPPSSTWCDRQHIISTPAGNDVFAAWHCGPMCRLHQSYNYINNYNTAQQTCGAMDVPPDCKECLWAPIVSSLQAIFGQKYRACCSVSVAWSAIRYQVGVLWVWHQVSS
jgi:hypothetical protein